MTKLVWMPAQPAPPELKRGISGVYALRNTVSGRVYIGSSVDVRRRWREHTRSLENGSHPCGRLIYDWQAYGRHSFQFELVSPCPPEELTVTEQLALSNSSNLYNQQRVSARKGSTFAKQRAVSEFEVYLQYTLPAASAPETAALAWERQARYEAALGAVVTSALIAGVAVGLPPVFGALGIIFGACTAGAYAWRVHSHPDRKALRRRAAEISRRVDSLRAKLNPN